MTGSSFIGFGAFLGWWSYGMSDSTHGFAGGFLSNLAAESLGVGFSIFAVSAGTWLLARNKVVEVTPAIFGLIQRLRIDKTITKEAAQSSVVCAVGLLSEGNVRKAIKRESNAPQGTECPICALKVDLIPHDAQKRCRHCYIHGAIWSDKNLVEEHERAKKKAAS